VPSGAIIMVAVLVAVVGYAVWYFMSGANRNLADVIPSLPDRFIALLTGGESTEAPQGPVVEPAPAAPAPTAAATPEPEIVPPAEAPAATAAPAAGAPTGSLSFGGTTAAAGAAAPLSQTLQPTSGSTTAAPATAAAEAPRTIVLRATAETWVQVEAPDGRILYSTVMKAGDSYTVPADRTDLKFVTGNARGVELTVGGQPVPNWSSKVGVVRNVPLDATRLMGGTAF
jgi:cytoskeleton protein RodZ